MSLPRISMPLLALLSLLSFAPPASSATMGLGPDAREVVETWATRLGLKVKAVQIEVDHAALDLDGCSIYLAHETGSRCSGLFMDAGGARACLSGNDCIAWSDFQQALERAGAVYPSWREVAVIPVASMTGGSEGANTQIPEDFAAALQALTSALVHREPTRAKAILSDLFQRQGLSVAQQLRFLPAAARLGLGRDALSQLGSGAWTSSDVRVTTVVRMALMMGPSMAVAVADALLDEASACAMVPMGEAFQLVGEHSAAAALGRALRQRDVKCFSAYALEVQAAYQAGERQAVADTFYQARGRFPEDKRLIDLELRALKATGQWRAAKFALDQRLKAATMRPSDYALLIEVLSQKSLKAEALIEWRTRLDTSPGDAVAAYVLGALMHLDKDYSGSFGLLTQAAKGAPGKVGKLHLLQALNAFSLRDMDTAKSELARALELTPRDPEAHWAAAEILRDVERLLAIRSLDIGLGLLPHRAMSAVRMRKQREALNACDGQGPCQGPWRYRPVAAK